MNIIKHISNELKVSEKGVNNTINLLEDGNTVPFISRYRKELTGNFNEEIIRKIDELNNYYKNLESYKETVLKSIDEQGQLTEDLKISILNCTKMPDLEDIYLPYKKRKKTKADKAIEAGLEDPTLIILNGKNIEKDFFKTYINDEYPNEDSIIEGISHIIGQKFAHDKIIREKLRNNYEKFGFIISNKKKDFLETETKYDMYNEFSQKISEIQDYRVLAINRGEKENILTVKLELHNSYINALFNLYMTNKSYNDEIISLGLDYGFKSLLNPSIEREIRQNLSLKAEESAINLFSNNLRQLLLTPPLKNKRILAIDPGFRTGCKVVAINEFGNFLEYNTIFPVPPKNDFFGSEKTVLNMIKKHSLNLIVIGNGTASRETQNFIVQVKKNNNLNIKYIFANEAGASVYSASKIAKQEFPDFDVTVRGAISIGRRIQDPLAELVKIDPKSIGVGQYQHDVNQKSLKEKLNNVVESVVNYVGVNLNTASSSLLQFVSGITPTISKRIIQYRENTGSFKSRDEIKNIKGLGPKSFEQSAGFLRIFDSTNPLDMTGIHPESYNFTIDFIQFLGYSIDKIFDKEFKDTLNNILNDDNRIKDISEELNIGTYTLEDIIKELLKPGRDLRDDLPAPILFDDVLNFEDLKEGMVLEGKITNITDFGAFVDLGIKESGLIHKSNLSDSYVKHPTDVVKINDIVRVEIIKIDKNLKRINLKRLNKKGA
ncbi:uncharacterized protein C7380_13015 [Oceanotoga teriensis]|jgi:uncharacterized protein|uniref:S1 motif domain-containing protein n=1 Tax=Oceanotoga teriensis TaxID=515440 RepID=A0AA45C4L4_9BACT|nr:Tex family protein [Oceanotoga teriensis]PWJ86732.1 uncharacterized protein C7380_13015 [Oceanotoga teriensis]